MQSSTACCIQEDHSSHKHAMALALVNGTTMEVAHGLAKSIVEVAVVVRAVGEKGGVTHVHGENGKHVLSGCVFPHEYSMYICNLCMYVM